MLNLPYRNINAAFEAFLAEKAHKISGDRLKRISLTLVFQINLCKVGLGFMVWAVFRTLNYPKNKLELLFYVCVFAKLSRHFFYSRL